jgi:hypothetical protein
MLGAISISSNGSPHWLSNSSLEAGLIIAVTDHNPYTQGTYRKREWTLVHGLSSIPAELAALASELAHDPSSHRRQAEAVRQGRL